MSIFIFFWRVSSIIFSVEFKDINGITHPPQDRVGVGGVWRGGWVGGGEEKNKRKGKQ